MADYLVLKLQGVMQAYGGHTFEDYRPTELFPTRSALVGLLGACLGLDRHDGQARKDLSDSFACAVRSDQQAWPAVRLRDFHTVLDARKVGGGTKEYPVVSPRDYLFDASFTVALRFFPSAVFGLEQIRAALDRPRYTPFLGRRSCPLGRPLFHGMVQAATLLEALAQVEPGRGAVYDEEGESRNVLWVRDVPSPGNDRNFNVRRVFFHAPLAKEEDHVSG